MKYPDGNWLVSTTVNLTRRADTGRLNSSPVSKSPAIIRFKEGCPQSFRIPVEDPDDDVVKCRWATYSESSRQTDSFPHGVIDEVISLIAHSLQMIKKVFFSSWLAYVLSAWNVGYILQVYHKHHSLPHHLFMQLNL